MKQYRVVHAQKDSGLRVAVELPAETCYRAIGLAECAAQRILADSGVSPNVELIEAALIDVLVRS